MDRVIDWNQARAFLAAAEGGSFSQAARQLHLSQPTLGRQVAALEQSLGVILFERAGRRLALTDAGRRLLDDFRAMGDAADRIALGAAAQSQSVEGHVSIAATDTVAALWLVPLLHHLGKLAPRLRIDLLVTDDTLDPGKREADIVVRHTRPTQSYLVARLLRETSVELYASPGYLARRGRPQAAADLAAHEFVAFAPLEGFLMAMQNHGLPVTREQVRSTCDSGLVMCEMLRSGLGIGVLTRLVGERHGDLEQVLPRETKIAFPLWLATHNELHTSRAVRLVFDLIAEGLSK